MFIHKSGNQALVFRRLSKLTDALYPITFLDVLAFHGSYFKARILQAGRTLVGLLGTDVTAPHPPQSWPQPPFSPCTLQDHEVLSLIFQGPPLNLFHSVFFLPPLSPLHSPSPVLPPPVSLLLKSTLALSLYLLGLLP